MAGIPTSPAVVFLEKDNSAYPPNIESSIVGIVGYASKGPTNEPTLITSQENLLRIFGKPNETLNGQGLEGALEILETTNQLRFVRANPADAIEASTQVEFGVCPAIKFEPSGIGTTYSSVTLKVSVKDSQGALVVDNQTITIASSTTNINDAIGQASAMAKIIGNGDSATDHMFMFYDPNSLGTGYLVSVYAGANATLSVSSNVSALTMLHVSSGEINTSLSAQPSVTASGATIYTSALNYYVKSLYEGDGYNLTTDANTGETLGVSVEIENAGGAKSFITVNNDGIAAETYKVSLINDTTFIENVINIGVDNKVSDYIKADLCSGVGSYDDAQGMSNILSQLSTLGGSPSSVGLKTAAGTLITPSGNPRFVKLINTTYDLSGGTVGTVTGVSAIIGSPALKTGIYALDDDLLNISLAVVPGISDQSVQNALVTLAEESQNFLAVVSPPLGLSEVQQATDWMNGRGYGRTSPINSSWASVFWPWVQVFDVFSGKDRWYDPSIFAIRQMAFTDNVAETWFAPAGFRRGRLTKPTAVELPMNQGDRDALYSNNVNPIVNFTPEGITVFGQKTAQRATTSLDRINVRRLMIFLRKVLLQTGRQDLFEPNDAFTWEVVTDKAESVLSDIQARRGITDYRVICDETVNTPIRVDRNELWCKILLKPTKTAEWIIFEVNLTNQSAKFSG